MTRKYHSFKGGRLSPPLSSWISTLDIKCRNYRIGEMWQNPNKEQLLKLTLAVYKVTALFPAGEELGLKIRESADNVLANSLSNEDASRYLDDILNLFSVAEERNWVDPRNFLILRAEYGKMRQVPVLASVNGNGNNHRQEKILAVMSSNGMVKIGDLIKMFPDINRRTVLRDLDKLCQVGVAVKNGKGRGAHYIKNGHNHTVSQ